MSANKRAERLVRLGDFIELCDERNADNTYTLDDVQGISIMKKLIPTKADMMDVSLAPYKLLKPNEFSYVTVTSRNSNKISLAINDTKSTYIVSSSYVNFRSKDKNILLPEYLYLLLSRSEFDRYARFNSWGSARETFDWDELCRVLIPLPSIEVQRELVATYNGLRSIAEQNEEIAESLKNACEAFISNCKGVYSEVELGKYIEMCDEKNLDNKYTLDHVRGISITKTLIDTKADMKDVDLTPYKILKPKEFSYVTVTSRNGNKISLAMNNTDDTYIVSSSYINFRCKDSNQLLPEFLYLLLSRNEFDRYARFNSWGSARETFDWNELSRVKVALPPIEVQQSIVNLFYCLEEARDIATEAIERLKTLCPALVQKAAN